MSERLAAALVRAAEGPLARVGPRVCGEVCLLGERFAAAFSLASEGPLELLARVDPRVRLKVVGPNESLAAAFLQAAEGPFARVDCTGSACAVCRVRLPGGPNALSQPFRRHLKGRSPVWIRMCAVRLPLCVRRLLVCAQKAPSQGSMLAKMSPFSTALVEEGVLD